MCLNLLFKTYQVTPGILKALFFDFIIIVRTYGYNALLLSP